MIIQVIVLGGFSTNMVEYHFEEMLGLGGVRCQTIQPGLAEVFHRQINEASHGGIKLAGIQVMDMLLMSQITVAELMLLFQRCFGARVVAAQDQFRGQTLVDIYI